MAQPRPACAYRTQHHRGPVRCPAGVCMQTPRGAVLYAGRMNHGANHQAERVGHYVTLAALDPLSCIEAARTAAFGGFHALAVDNAR